MAIATRIRPDAACCSAPVPGKSKHQTAAPLPCNGMQVGAGAALLLRYNLVILHAILVLPQFV